MSTTVQTVQNACGNCDRFGFGETNFGTKYMSDLMQTQAPWAEPILNADRLEVVNARTLNPTNGRRNTYGALVAGLAIRARNWESADPSVKAALAKWIENLNELFPRHTKYTPDELQQWATDLSTAADCISRQSATLAQTAEITTGDHTYLTGIVEGLNSLAANLRALREAVCAGPGISEVNLDFPIQQH
jgi:hypothetical protein